jgi:hypothetical protein
VRSACRRRISHLATAFSIAQYNRTTCKLWNKYKIICVQIAALQFHDAQKWISVRQLCGVHVLRRAISGSPGAWLFGVRTSGCALPRKTSQAAEALDSASAPPSSLLSKDFDIFSKPLRQRSRRLAGQFLDRRGSLAKNGFAEHLLQADEEIDYERREAASRQSGAFIIKRPIGDWTCCARLQAPQRVTVVLSNRVGGAPAAISPLG